jgi:hypothetical protein
LRGYTFISEVSGTWKLINYPDPHPRTSRISSPYRFLRLQNTRVINLELGERLDSARGLGVNLQHVEANSLGERTALADGNHVTLLNTESGGDVGRQVLVAALVTVVLRDVVEVFAADDKGTVHLGGDDFADEDTATDGHLGSEGALLVCKRFKNE